MIRDLGRDRDGGGGWDWDRTWFLCSGDEAAVRERAATVQGERKCSNGGGVLDRCRVDV
jgi:hypothetical protein